MIRRKLTVAFLATMVAFPATGFAVDNDTALVRGGANTVTRALTVRTNDLNLDDPRGRAAVEQRVRLAAQQACGRVDMYGVRPPADYRRCLDQSVSNAMAQVTTTGGAALGGAN
ncbi:UrcA family protein [Sphingomonas sp. S1-29]|uniref:UrcA family protein n=1 Tax=Sphingomonas sp. S1-29 TaxID=2991074 RepID=UPI00223F1352|nr:UrcA family protein [Sphingomonas sp. S1-29]UZK70104.1 UrcA family protein [Sphingomonas sp. S1-29]